MGEVKCELQRCPCVAPVRAARYDFAVTSLFSVGLPFGHPPAADADPLCRVALIEPLIPQNTGNIARTCVATGSELHLVGPLGFEMTEKRVRRAGLDYWQHLTWMIHTDFAAWQNYSLQAQARIFFLETHATESLFNARFQRGDWLVFGNEAQGLSAEFILQHQKNSLLLPMPGPVRSLNLSNAAAISVFELLRQTQDQTIR